MLSGTFANEVRRPSCGKLRECTRVGYESAYRCHIQPKKGLTSTWSRSPRTTSRSGPARFDQAGAARKAWTVLRTILRLAYRKGSHRQ